MRKPAHRRELPLPIIVGCIIGVVLIGVALLGKERRSLVDVFHAAPTPEIPALFGTIADASHHAVSSWLSDGASLPVMTPQAVGPRIAVHVDSMHRTGSVLEIRGTILNHTGAVLPFSVNNFHFVDANGIPYGTNGTANTITITDVAPFAFNIPVPPSRVLTMTVTFAPDPPLVITLLQERNMP